MIHWVRLWHDMPTDPKWRIIARRAQRPQTEVLSIFMMMMLNAGANDENRGRLSGWDDEDAAAALDMETEHVTAIREAMQGKTLDGDYLTGWDKRQPKREDGSAERAKAWRERKKAETNASTNEANASNTEANDAERKRTQANADERTKTHREESESESEKNISSLRSDARSAAPTPTNPEPAKPAKPSRAKPRTQIAEDAQPTEKDRDFALNEIGMTMEQFRNEWRKFRDHHRAKGSLMACWSAAWRTWAGNVPEFQRTRPARPAERRNPAFAAGADLMEEYINGSNSAAHFGSADSNAAFDFGNPFAHQPGAGAGRPVQILDLPSQRADA